MARKFYPNSGESRLRHRQELARHGFHRLAPVGHPEVLPAAQAQTRRDGGRRLAVADELQRQGLPRGQDHRGPLDRLLEQCPRRMYVGDSAAATAPAREP